MATLFVEYRIKPEHTQAHLQALRALMRENPSLQALESADEPGLYVELWQSPGNADPGLARARTEQLGRGRTEKLARARTEQLAPLAEGGAARVRCWTFNNIDDQ